MINLVQILIILFALFALSRVVLRFKDGKLSKAEFTGWAVLWLAVIVFAALPVTAGFFARILKIGRPVDVLVYGGIIVLFYLMFRIYVKIEGIERQITKVVRETALKKKK